MVEWATGGFLGFVEGVFQFLFVEGGVGEMGVLFTAFHFFIGDRARGALVD